MMLAINNLANQWEIDYSIHMQEKGFIFVFWVLHNAEWDLNVGFCEKQEIKIRSRKSFFS